MNVDVQIYVSNFVKFFTNNPNELKNLFGVAEPESFFTKVEEVANKNFDNGEDVELTQKQMIGVILELNQMQPKEEVESLVEPYFETSYGKIFLN